MVNMDVLQTSFKWHSVSRSEIISRGKRLEASVYMADAYEAFRMAECGKYGCMPLYGKNGFVKKAGYGGRLKRKYVSAQHEKAIGFLGSSEMLDSYPRPVKFMADGDACREFRVTPGMVLLSRSGTIGNVVFSSKTLSKFLVSEHAIRLECECHPGYVYAFLKTKIGKQLVCANHYGAVIQEIEPEHLEKVPIPNAPWELKNQIHDLIVHSYQLRDEANSLVDEAMMLLEQELSLPKISVLRTQNEAGNSTGECFSVRLHNLSGRLDASYHLPVVNAITDHLIKHAKEVKPLGSADISAAVILPGRFKRVYVQEGYGRVFIGGKQLGELDPSNKKYLSLAHHMDRIARWLELHENMTLITCSGTIGKVALVGRQWENWTANQHIIRVVPAHEDIAGYLYIFLLSDYGYELIVRHTYGSVVDEIDDSHVRQIPIPLLENGDMQKKINELALFANQKRYEAYQMEQKALEIMEKEVIGTGSLTQK